MREVFPEVEALHISVTSDGPPRQVRQGPLDSMVRAVCQSCNSGWMSRLEQRTKPLLIQMIKGKRVEIDMRKQRDIAAWAVKTIMVQNQLRPEAYTRIPSEDYVKLATRVAPLSNMIVWSAHMTPPRHGRRIEHASDFLAQEYRDSFGGTAYVGCLRVGHWVARVLRFDGLNERYFLQEKQHRQMLTKLWPAHGTRVWPPTRSIDNLPGGFLAFASLQVGAPS